MSEHSAALHPWDVTPAEARAIQERLRGRLETEDRLGLVRRVAGADVGFDMHRRLTRAAVAVLAFPSLERVEHALARRPTTFPYVPGLLSFREVPAILDALGRLEQRPDLLLCDGHGVAHPRRFGFASHLGVLAGIPSIGVAKKRLLGTHDEVPDRRGAWVPLMDAEEVIGAVLRSRAGVKPVFVSIGHRVSLPTAVDYVMRCTGRYRLPETTRWAHRLASDM
ncbi:MAG: deoxyribonuclease V [Gammaproteobacteria bacterium]|nr:deoxyribonuclease V [Gammaproteobacteria bacterium]NIR83655.1 deoxyribonuclease V [Gammaproteobacteria bacterium]NIR91630.1 deoxyribonuclease V [Gammaproteobacteria bacterium]NIU04817.1 deoxyribonuclease V [Gammaproteobacteria bacterium]NIV51803.1 deoxyribonuclease V [Gammaproteobacteria bacterium]